MPKIVYSFAILLSTLISGCAEVRTTTTPFYIDNYSNTGTITVVAKTDPNSLETASFKSKIERKLEANGYQIAANPAEAQYVAFFSYGIDNGKTETETSPVYGQIGGGSTYSSGTVMGAGGSAIYSGSTYTMPTYGVIGSTTSTTTVYTRSIALDIVLAPSLATGTPKKVYESRAKSEGVCGVMAGVFDEILEAMFKNFPGKNGIPHKVDVKWDKHKC